MNNIKVIRLGQTLDWDHSFNCSLKKYNGIDGILDFSNYIKIVFENKKFLKKYKIKFSHCRVFHKGNLIVVDIFIQDLNFIDKIIKNKKLNKLVNCRVRRLRKMLKHVPGMINHLKFVNILKKIFVNTTLNKYQYLNTNIKKKKDLYHELLVNRILGVENKRKKNFILFLIEFERLLNIKMYKVNLLNIRNKQYKFLKLKYYMRMKKNLKSLDINFIKIYDIHHKYYQKNFFSFKKRANLCLKNGVIKFLNSRSKYYRNFKKILIKFKSKKKALLLKLINRRIGITCLGYKNNKNIRLLKKYNRFQILKYLDIENCLSKASFHYFKKNVFFNYCILDNYIFTSNIIVKYICDRLKQGFFLGEILKDVQYVLSNSKDIIGFRIDCFGRFGRKRRTSFKRLSVGKLLKSKINAIIDCSMDFVILKFGCCNVKVLLNKREDYREFRYKFNIY